MSGSVSSSSSAVSTPSLEVSKFLKTLDCPVKGTPLTDAVILVPCGHTISEIAANNIFRGMRDVNGTETVENQDLCPLCCDRVTAYYPNLIMRTLVTETLGVKMEEALPMISATCSADDKVNIDVIPFPGIGANFVLTRNEWKFSLLAGCDLVRELEFNSQTRGSLFSKFSVLGYRDGSVCIFLKWEKICKDTVNDYLSKCGIKLSFLDCNLCHYMSNQSTNELVFRILAKHNEIPQDQLNIIRELVISGNWKAVTLFPKTTPVPDVRDV